jgi:hypothetical protein
MHGLLSLIGVILPKPAGLILAAAITSLGCAALNAGTARLRGEPIEWEISLGGVIIAALLGVIGLILVGLGAPAFK